MPLRSTIVFLAIATLVAAIVWGVVVVAGRTDTDPRASRGTAAKPVPGNEGAAPAEASFINAA